jgi:hypothetical protein
MLSSVYVFEPSDIDPVVIVGFDVLVEVLDGLVKPIAVIAEDGF